MWDGIKAVVDENTKVIDFGYENFTSA